MSPTRIDQASTPVANGSVAFEIARLRSELAECEEALNRTLRENAYLAHLLDDVREGVLATDLDGRIVYWGRGAERLYGYRRCDILGRDARVLTDQRDLAGAANRRATALSNGAWTGTYRKRRVDGTVIWVHRSLSPMRDDDGEVWGFVAVDRDETSTRMTREALLESDRLLRSLAEHLSAVYWVEDIATGQPILVSSGCQAVYGLEPAEFTREPGRRFDRIHPDDRELVREASRRSGDSRIEYRLVVEGETRWIKQQTFEVLDARGKTSRRGVLAEDVTHERRALERADQQRAVMAHVARGSTMGEMASSLAHELNQPLCAIANEAQACLRGIANGTFTREETIEGLTDLRNEALRAGEIVKRVRESVAKSPPSRGWIAIGDVVDDVLALHENRLRETGTKVVRHVGRDLPELSGDRVQVEQVVSNLLSNAVDAMETVPRPNRRVTITIDAEPKRMVLVVADTGCGIPAEELDRVFEAYVTTKPGGLGMGLAICRTIVESHGGTLHAAPNPPRGTRFTMTLPLEEAP